MYVYMYMSSPASTSPCTPVAVIDSAIQVWSPGSLHAIPLNFDTSTTSPAKKRETKLWGVPTVALPALLHSDLDCAQRLEVGLGRRPPHRSCLRHRFLAVLPAVPAAAAAAPETLPENIE